MSLLILSFILLGAQRIFGQNCPPSFIYDSGLNGCYYAYANGPPYDEMENDCRRFGGDLITAHNAFENNRIGSIAAASRIYRLFLGTRRSSVNGSFYNLDGTPLYYANWGAGQPLGDDCATIDPSDNFWYTMSCTASLPAYCFVAQSSPTVPPTSAPINTCPAGWSYYAVTRYCYYVGNDATFYDAMQRCSQMGASLASVHSYQENSFIVGLTLGITSSCGQTPYANDVWLGGIYNNNVWTWIDGSPLDYNRFYGSPKSGVTSLTVDSSCGDFTDWRGRDASELLQYFICKRVSNV